MIYCPKCGRVTNNLVCDECSCDISCVNEEKYSCNPIHYFPRNNIMTKDNELENQEFMKDVLRKDTYKDFKEGSDFDDQGA